MIGVFVSQVVPREYQSSEHHYNSVQRRKRGAMSLADPLDIMKRGGPTLEESSELTRCLTPEEVENLNQGRGSGSPNDRVRLFSFTRGLKNPFSKSRRRDKEVRDKLVSPDKEQQMMTQHIHQQQLQEPPHPHQQQLQGRGTPTSKHHPKHSSPVGRSNFDRTEGMEEIILLLLLLLLLLFCCCHVVPFTYKMHTCLL